MLELLGLLALIYIVLRWGGTILGTIAKIILFVIVMLLVLPILWVMLQAVILFAALFWVAVFV